MVVAPEPSTKDGCQYCSSVIATFYLFFNKLHSLVTELLQIKHKLLSNVVGIGFWHMFNRGSIFSV
jgi:Na+-driven multidrug efflux pump